MTQGKKQGRVLAVLLALAMLLCAVPAYAAGPFSADGSYYVDLALWNEVLDQASMGGVAFKNNPRALVTVSGGKVTTVEFATNPVDVGVYHSALIDMKSEEAPDISELETGTMTTVPANKTYSYIKRAAFTMPESGQPKSADDVTYVKVQFLVPDTPMGNGFMTARLKFSWSTATATTDKHLVSNDTTARGTSELTGEDVVDVNLVDAATGIKLDTDTDHLSNGAKLSVARITDGEGYAAAQKALASETGSWKLYRVLAYVDDVETAPQGQVKLSFPCAQEPKAYRVNDSGTKVAITGEYKDGYYVFNTSRLGLFAIVGGSFTDVPDGAYYEQAVTWALTHQPQVTNGTGGGKFSPNATVDRGQTVTFLWRAAGCPEPTGSSNPFTDVKSTDYYYKAVLWAVEKGVTNGTSATTFSPKDPVKRNQVVTFLWRTLGEPNKTGAGTWYDDAVNWANANGLLTGTAEAYSHNADCPRCDVVLYLFRALA